MIKKIVMEKDPLACELTTPPRCHCPVSYLVSLEILTTTSTGQCSRSYYCKSEGGRESLADSHCLPELRTRPRSVPTHKSVLLSQVRTLRNTSVKLPDWLHTLEQFLYRSSKQTASGIQNFSRHYSRGQRPIQLSCEDAYPTVGGKTHLKLLKCVTQTPFKSKLCYKTHKMNFIPLSFKYTLRFC